MSGPPRPAPAAPQREPIRAGVWALAGLGIGWLALAANGLSWLGGRVEIPLAAAPALLLAAALLGSRGARRPEGESAAWVLGLCLALAVSSDLFRAHWFPWQVGLLFGAALPLAALLAARPRPIGARSLLALLLLGQAGLAAAFLLHTGAAALTRDDHPSFLYRLQLLRELFPAVTGFDPRWNAGRLITETATTGVLTVAPLWLGLAGLFPGVGTDRLYTPFLAVLFLGLWPWMFYVSVRLFGGDRRASLCGALLALYPGSQFFVHLLSWGVFPSLIAMGLAVPAAGGLYRLAIHPEPDRRAGPLLAASVGLAAWWPASSFTFFPVGLIAAGALPFLAPARRRAVLLWGGIGLVLALPAARAVLLGGEFANISGLQRSASLLPAWSAVRANLAHVGQISPLVLALGLPGAFALRRRPLALGVSLCALALLLLITVGHEYRRQFQLVRLVDALGFLLTVPAALAAGWLLGLGERRLAPVRALVLAALGVSLLSAGMYWTNRGFAPYKTLEPANRDFVELLRREVPPQGRVFWGGVTMHSFAGGHIAALPYLSGRMMLAADFYHFHPAELEEGYDLRPRWWRSREHPERTEEYFEHFNVSHVATINRGWRRLLESRPERYELVTVVPGGSFELALYRRRNFRDSLVERGQAVVTVLPGRIRLEGLRGGEEVLLRFAWAPGLRSRPPAALEPEELPGGLRLLRVRPGGATSLEIAGPRW